MADARLDKVLPRHLKGLRGWDLAVGAILTPVLIPFWVLGWCAHRISDIQEWWWTDAEAERE